MRNGETTGIVREPYGIVGENVQTVQGRMRKELEKIWIRKIV